MKHEIMTFEEADEHCDGALSAVFQGSYDKVLLLSDPKVLITGSFLEGLKVKGDYEVIAIPGDLTVEGRIQLYENYPALWVGGTTKAQTLEGGDAEVYINDGQFDYFVYGYYNDGILETGSVTVPWVINSDHDLRVSADKAKTIDNYGDDDDYDFGSETIAEAFVAEVRGADDEANEIDIEAFYQRLVSGKPVLVAGGQSAKEKALSQVKGAKQSKKTELVVTKKLKAFPSDVLKMPWLKRLVLDECELGSIPAGIAKLTELEELSLAGCDLKSLPDAIGKLSKLRVLNLAGNTGLKLPSSLGNLKNLEELDLSNVTEKLKGDGLPGMRPFKLPASLAKTKLRVLRANSTNLVLPKAAWKLEVLEMEGQSWAHLIEFPDWIPSLTSLKELRICSNFYRSIPSLNSLVNLEVLSLSGGLARVKALPKLNLPKLRHLGLSGNSSHTGVAEPSPTMVRALFSMKLPALERLELDRWGRGPKDPPRAKLDISGLSTFKKTLKWLDLEFDSLETLPDDFYELTALEEVLIDSYAKVSAKTLAKLKKSLPKLKVTR